MEYPAYTASEMHLITDFSSHTGIRSADETLKRYRDVIDPLRDEAKAMILLVIGKDQEEVRKKVPKIPDSHWKRLVEEVLPAFQKAAEARRREAEARRKRSRLRMYLRPV